MSWHTNAILIKGDFSGDYPGLFAKLGLKGATAGKMASFDDAASTFNEGVAIAIIDGWTALWGNMALYMVKNKALAETAKDTVAFQMMLEGTSGTAGFTWWDGGKVARNWLRQGGKLIKNEGQPLPEEQQAFAEKDDEQAVLQLLTTLVVPVKKLAAHQYQMYNFPEGALFGL